MIIDLKVKTLDSQTYEFTVDDGMTLRQFKETIAEKTKIAADLQRMIFCGRVLVDEKHLKDYNVAGKVIHLVERPPPDTSSLNNTTTSSSRNRSDSENSGMRGSPMFRALDGMVVGSVTIPINAGGQNSSAPNMPPLTPSSSFCMNRIIVARHMLECANNIAAYLENPNRGLHNPPMDILAEGRWTMESTVVEVGISSGNPQDDHEIAEALHGVVSAALRQNASANVRVMQLPTVFGANDTNRDVTQQTVTPIVTQNRAPGVHTVDSVETMLINNGSNAARTNPFSPNYPVTASTSSESRSSGEHTSSIFSEEENSSSGPRPRNRQRTSCAVLAELVREMRSVQERLDPFIQQYHDILDADPDTSIPSFREEVQRVFDRVSEALHYMSHAQHSISDLMLDLSQPPPRFLCCRPILVEQSGYVSTNMASFLHQNGQLEPIPNTHMQFISPTMNTVGRIPTPNSPLNPALNPVQAPRPQVPVFPPSTEIPSEGTLLYLNPNSQNPHTVRVHTAEQAETARRLYELFDFQGPVIDRYPLPGVRQVPSRATHQMQVARFIQAVVNSSPMEGAEANSPWNMTAMLTNPYASPQQPHRSQSSTTIPPGTRPSNIQSNQARVTTATHPTTSTQTRSTSRPQVHVGNINPWSARVIPISNVSAFDRFLPCSSHHINDVESNTEPTTQNASTNPFRPVSQPNVTINQIGPYMSSQTSTFPTNPAPTTSTAESSTDIYPSPTPDLWFTNSVLPNQAVDNDHTEFLNRIRTKLMYQVREELFVGHVNENLPIIEYAVLRLVNFIRGLLIYLPQYDMGHFDSRMSMQNVLQKELIWVMRLIFEDNTSEYANRFVSQVLRLLRRCYSVLVTTIGKENTRVVWKQYTSAILEPDNYFRFLGNDQAMFLKFHKNMMISVGEYNFSRAMRSEVQEFILRRNRNGSDSEDEYNASSATDSEILPRFQLTTIDDAVPMDIEDLMLREGSSGINAPTNIEPNIPDAVIVLPTTEANDSATNNNVSNDLWHNDIKSEWIPFLSNDKESQKTARAQAPFSNAYICGMSAKRRKTLQSSKTPTDLPALIETSVTQAIESNNADIPGNSTNDETSATAVIASTMSADVHIRQSLNETLRQRLTERLQSDPDFDEEKFPNSSNYFSK